MHRRWHVVQADKTKVTLLLSMKGRKSLEPHDQIGFKEQVWLELHLKGGKEFDNRSEEQRVETWRRGLWRHLICKMSLGGCGKINSQEGGSSGRDW